MKKITSRLSSSSYVQIVIRGMTLLLAALAVAAASVTPKAFASHASTQNAGEGAQEKFQRVRMMRDGISGSLNAGEVNQADTVPESPTANTLINNNNGSTGVAFFTQSETSLVVFGNTIVAGFNDSGSNAGATNHFTGWSRSTDGGATWTDGGALPNSSAGDAGDPVLARDNTSGRIYFATLGFTDDNVIQVFRSTDNGATWLAPVNGTPGGASEDKDWITVDNFAGSGNGNVYLVARNFGAGNGIYLTRSTDGGATFGPSGGTLIVSGMQGAFVTVSPDHSVHVFWYAGSNLAVRKSTDQGITFTAPTTFAPGLMGGVNGDLGLTGLRQGTGSFSPFRTNEFPHAAVNPVSGNVYVTYDNKGAGADKADVFFVQSTDGGATWSTPLKVNDDSTTTDQWMPTVAVSPTGDKLGIFYYSRQEDPANNNLFKRYGRIATISGGTVTFAPSFAVSDTASLPEFGRDSVVNSTYMGDYDQVYATSGAFHMVWSDNRNDLPGGAPRKDPNVYYNKIAGPSAACSSYVTGQIGGSIVPGTTDAGNHGDDVVTTIPLPFPYTFYDTTYTNISVSSNGNAQFTTTDTSFNNSCLPWTSHNYTIFPYWDDQRTDNLGWAGCAGYPGGTCGIFTSVSGSAPNRIFNIEFRSVYFANTAQRANFELRLYEDQARFDVIYGTVDRGNTSATAGVQKSDTNFTQYFCNGSGSPATGGQRYVLSTATPTDDFNHDGKPDYVLYNGGTRQTAVWHMNNNVFADGAFGPTLPAGWNVIDVADFDGDGNLDYALFNPSTHQTAIWYLSGVTFISGAFGPTLPSAWTLVATADFNFDCDPDYVLYNASTRQTAIWYMNGNVFTGGVFGPTLPAGWRLAGVADFDADGKTDYLLFNTSTRQSAIWYLSGVTLVGGAFGPTIASGYELTGTADFNGDGKPDYLLFNSSTRQTAIWYMNNNVLAGGAFGPTLPPAWNLVAP
jgi:FG-GAP-like repeat